MKRLLALLLCVLMIAGVFACTKPQPTESPAATAAPADSKQPESNPSEPTATPEPYWTYAYEYGSIALKVDLSMPEQPTDTGTSLVFAAPDGAWTATLTPLSVHGTEIALSNLKGSYERNKEFGFYQNRVFEDRTGVYADPKFAATFYSFERNPNWVEREQGYSTSYREAHAILIFSYGDTIVGPWGGLEVDVSLPENTTDPIAPVLADPALNTLLHGITFVESGALKEVAIPGLRVSFPARWSTSSDGDHTIWAAIGGATRGSIYFGSSIYADPKVAAGYIAESYQTLNFGGRTWYGAVRTSTLSESTLKSLELFTDFTEYHALSMKLNLYDWQSDDDFWAYTKTETFETVMNAVVTDPASFHNPEDDRKNADGYEVNTIAELSGYTGTATDLVIPAVVGTSEVVGINTNVFKGNRSITSVVLSEGIRYIEYGAFRDCTNLKSVVLPNSLTYIDYHAFEGCTALESVSFGSGLVTIGSEAFRGCASLGDVILPDTVARIQSGAFNQAGNGTGRFVCPASGTVYEHNALIEANFTAVEIGPNADLSDYNIMQSLKATSLTIGEGCTALGDYFVMDPYANDTTLQSISLPDTIQSVGKHAFSGRLGVKELNLSALESMGESACYQTGLVNITVPGTLKTVPNSAFASCPDVMTITIEEGVEFADEWAFSECGRTFYQNWQYDWFTPEEAAQHPEYVKNGTAPYDHIVTISIPSTLTKVGYGAFCGMFEYVYMLWLTEPNSFPTEWDNGAFASARVLQVYFTEETFNTYGSKLDDIVSGFKHVDRVAYYFDGKEAYWTEYQGE